MRDENGEYYAGRLYLSAIHAYIDRVLAGDPSNELALYMRKVLGLKSYRKSF